MKSQIPNPKSQINPKHQIPMTQTGKSVWNLADWNLEFAWDLVLGIWNFQGGKGVFAAILLLCSCLAAPSSAQVRLDGYAKTLPLQSKSFFSNETYFYDLSRLRLQGIADVGNFLHAEIWLDTEALAGNYLETLDYQVSQALQRPKFLDLDWTLHESEQFVLQQRIFRGFVDVYLGQTQITLGRQRIAWGTGFAWNPTDLLNPYNPFAVERQEREGVDALYLAQPLGVLSKLEFAYAPGRGDLKTSAAARLGLNFKGYDYSLMTGFFQEDWVVGGDFAGYVGGAGLRGEYAYTWKREGRDFFRAVVNMDYNFPKNYYAMLEFYYNGQGATDKADYDYTLLLTGQSLSLARYYAAGYVTKELTPLLRLDLYGIVNLVDGSNLLGPALTYSVFTSLEASANVYFFNGGDDTELGGLGNAYFAVLQVYF